MNWNLVSVTGADESHPLRILGDLNFRAVTPSALFFAPLKSPRRGAGAAVQGEHRFRWSALSLDRFLILSYTPI